MSFSLSALSESNEGIKEDFQAEGDKLEKEIENLFLSVRDECERERIKPSMKDDLYKEPILEIEPTKTIEKVIIKAKTNILNTEKQEIKQGVIFTTRAMGPSKYFKKDDPSQKEKEEFQPEGDKIEKNIKDSSVRDECESEWIKPSIKEDVYKKSILEFESIKPVDELMVKAKANVVNTEKQEIKQGVVFTTRAMGPSKYFKKDDSNQNAKIKKLTPESNEGIKEEIQPEVDKLEKDIENLFSSARGECKNERFQLSIEEDVQKESIVEIEPIKQVDKIMVKAETNFESSENQEIKKNIDFSGKYTKKDVVNKKAEIKSLISEPDNKIEEGIQPEVEKLEKEIENLFLAARDEHERERSQSSIEEDLGIKSIDKIKSHKPAEKITAKAESNIVSTRMQELKEGVNFTPRTMKPLKYFEKNDSNQKANFIKPISESNEEIIKKHQPEDDKLEKEIENLFLSVRDECERERIKPSIEEEAYKESIFEIEPIKTVEKITVKPQKNIVNTEIQEMKQGAIFTTIAMGPSKYFKKNDPNQKAKIKRLMKRKSRQLKIKLKNNQNLVNEMVDVIINLKLVSKDLLEWSDNIPKSAKGESLAEKRKLKLQQKQRELQEKLESLSVNFTNAMMEKVKVFLQSDNENEIKEIISHDWAKRNLCIRLFGVNKYWWAEKILKECPKEAYEFEVSTNFDYKLASKILKEWWNSDGI
ncbi:unnamed protein product [Blepharisma stoltei]|uniref:Uncharacterized protein n=1 Tax=Blepharisma stoltei TaxID=1481888 RepID=A0AAU9JX93_9CILI|nr:unnamed protein product [Blepharisma stoltei]